MRECLQRRPAMNKSNNEFQAPRLPFWRTPWGIAFVIVLVAALGLIAIDHKAHALGFMPYALLAACPLMHLFHHRGHRHGPPSHHHERETAGADKQDRTGD